MARVDIVQKMGAGAPPDAEPDATGSPVPVPLESTDPDDTWSARRARQEMAAKHAMGRYFANHDFLVNLDEDGVMTNNLLVTPEKLARRTVASILVNQGTTPSVVVDEALSWVGREKRIPDITWYTPGSLVPGNLRALRLKYPRLRSATRVFLFPGQVDPETEAVSGPEALRFAEGLKRRFTSALLGAYCFLMSKGEVLFHYADEIPLQRACARLYAAHKFLFVDSTKFRAEGDPGYGIADMLDSSEMVTIYSVQSDANQRIENDFEILCSKVLEPAEPSDPRSKTLRLCLVAQDETTPILRRHCVCTREIASSSR